MIMVFRKSLTYTICLLYALISIPIGVKGSPAAPSQAPPWNGAASVMVCFALPCTGAPVRPATGTAPPTDAGDANSQPNDPQEEVRLVVNTDERTLTVLAGQEVIGVYPVAIGKWTTPTPIGEWKIIDKDYDWGGAFGSRWMGLDITWGRYGIHGTNQPGSISYESSLGCLRMFNDDVVQIFDLVKTGTKVDIIGPPHETNLWHDVLDSKSVGPDVVYAQLALKKHGFYPYRCDGIFGQLSNMGVRCFQALEGLSVTGKVDEETNRLLHEETSSSFESIAGDRPADPGSRASGMKQQ
jgi:lipoprotein-anchoring transpeptidase ErfK/SrfK